MEELEDDANIASAPARHLVLRQGMHGGIAYQHFPGGWAVDPGNHIDQRRFAAARFTNHPHKLTPVDLQINAVQRGKTTRRGFIRFHHLAQLNQMAVAIAELPVGHIIFAFTFKN